MCDTIVNHRVPNMKTVTRINIQDKQVVVQSHERTPSLAMTSIDNRIKNCRSKIIKRTFAELSNPKDSTLTSRAYEGRIIVNGFHPQLTTSSTDYCPSKDLLNALPRVSDQRRTLDERISNTVINCRINELTEMRKRLRVSPLDLIPPRYHDQIDRDNADQELIATGSPLSNSYNDSFKKSNVPQFIADIGGRGVSCNSEFLKLCGASLQEPSTSFTLVNLIVPSLRFKLFELLSRAVGDEIYTRPSQSNGKDNQTRQFSQYEDSSLLTNAVASMSHPEPSVSTCSRIDGKDDTCMSITLPCIPLPASKIPQNVTIIHMNDAKLDNRCFLSILSPVIPITSEALNDRPPGSYFESMGDIQFVRQDYLLRLLQARR